MGLIKNQMIVLEEQLNDAKIKFAEANLDKDNWSCAKEREIDCKILEGQINILSKLQDDFEGAFFYCDPPYTSGCGYEVTSTANFDHEPLKDVLGSIKGRFLLSYDDSLKVRELYKGYEMIEVERLNGINNRERTDRTNKIFKELLVTNYPIKDLFKNVWPY